MSTKTLVRASINQTEDGEIEIRSNIIATLIKCGVIEFSYRRSHRVGICYFNIVNNPLAFFFWNHNSNILCTSFYRTAFSVTPVSLFDFLEQVDNPKVTRVCLFNLDELDHTV